MCIMTIIVTDILIYPTLVFPNIHTIIHKLSNFKSNLRWHINSNLGRFKYEKQWVPTALSTTDRNGFLLGFQSVS